MARFSFHVLEPFYGLRNLEEALIALAFRCAVIAHHTRLLYATGPSSPSVDLSQVVSPFEHFDDDCLSSPFRFHKGGAS